MSLTPLTGASRPHRFRGFALARKDLHVLSVAVAGDSGVAVYSNLHEFIARELTKKNSWITYYGHGMSFDSQFLIHALRRAGLTVELLFAGQNALKITVTRGKSRWQICDAAALVDLPPADAAALVGGSVATAEQRARSAYQMVGAVRDSLERWGGEQRITLASSALALFRRAYVRGELRTSKVLNETCRPAFYASRTETFRDELCGGFAYDLNSAFGSGFTLPVPGELRRTAKTVVIDPDALYVADVSVRVPECFLPPLPVRGPLGRIFFPHGAWRAMYSAPDLALLVEAGGTVERVHVAYEFAPFSDAARFVADLYGVRATGTPLQRFLATNAIRYLYGKFAEQDEKELVLINPPSTTCPHDGAHVVDGRSTCMQMLAPGIYLCRETLDVPHAHLPIAATVTARVRRTVTKLAWRAESLAMIGTDAIHSRTRYPSSEAMGELRHQYDIARAVYVAPMFYAVDTGQTRFVRAKGMRLSWDELLAFREGAPLAVRDEVPIRTRVTKHGETEPLAREYVRRLDWVCPRCSAYLGPARGQDRPTCPAHPGVALLPLHGCRPKRRPVGDSSEPWSYEEVMRPWTPRGMAGAGG